MKFLSMDQKVGVVEDGETSVETGFALMYPTAPAKQAKQGGNEGETGK